MSDYRVQLDVFSGPLDLLLYLIRRDEVDILDIPLARITEQYIEHVRLLQQLDPDTAGEFLVLASTLIELKSRSLLPSPPLEDLDDTTDPRAPLVRQLLEYKRFKDAARQLGRAADDRAARYVRRPAARPKELEGLELEEVQVWDLLTAFGRVMTAIGQGPGRQEIHYADVPIELHAAEIVAILEREGPTTFETLFDGQADRLQVIGRFLALLELIRSHRVRAEQERIFGTIYLFLLEEVPDEAPAPQATAAPLSEPPPSAAMEALESAPGVAEVPSAPSPSEEAPHEHTE
ncbi:MAG: segregation/condensation protein A [Planctomycetota bacterium]